MKMMNNRKHLRVVLFLLFLGTGLSSFGQCLKDYQQMALEKNPNIRAALAEYKIAQQKVEKAGGWADPMLSVGAFARDLKTGEAAEIINVSLMQKLPWFGSITAKENVAEFMGKAEFQTLQDVKKQMLLSVSQQYYTLFLNRKQIKIQQANLQILEDYKKIALAKVRSGEGLVSDVLQVDILMDGAQTQLKILRLSKRNLETTFNLLLHRNRHTKVVLPDSLFLKPTQKIMKDDSLFVEHPKVQKWENMRESAEASQVLARKSGMPLLSVGVEYMKEPMGMNMQMEMLMPMVSVSIPIFRGKYKAAEKEAEWQENSYEHQREAAKNNLATAYAQAQLVLQKNKANLRLKQAQISKAKQILSLMITSYQNSQIDFEDVLQMRKKLLSYQLERIQAKTNYFIGLAQMKYVLAD